MSRLSTIALGVLALSGAPLAAAHAQSNVADPYNPARFTVEPYLSHTWLDTDVGDREGLGGFGARVMFGHSSASNALSTVFNRARVGAFLTYHAEQKDFNLSAIHYGVEADFPLLAAPRDAGTPLMLDPFVSLGAGIFHTSVDAGEGTNLTSNDFALTPAAGILIPITGEIKFRGDLRDAIVFGQGSTSNNFVLEGGISIGF